MSRKNYKYDILLVATFKRKTYVTYGKVMDSYETLGGTSVQIELIEGARIRYALRKQFQGVGKG